MGGYSRVNSPEAFCQTYTRLLEAVRGLGILAGFCYTQFTDTYQEANGLLYADRTPNFPIAEIRAATGGNQICHEPIEWEWRERLMDLQRTQYLMPSDDYGTQRGR